MSNSRTTRITSLLTKKFQPSFLEIEDKSHLHAGHAGARPEGKTHMKITITASAFAGLGKVARHRLVYAALSDEFKSGLHAVEIDARS